MIKKADKVSATDDSITVDGKEIKIYAVKEAGCKQLPMGRDWRLM